MAKGLFTQGVCVLLRHGVSIESIAERLGGFSLAGQHATAEGVDSDETLVYHFRPESGGHLLVTPSSIPWPDDMGDPDETPDRFIAWSLGQFGPLAFPGCLKRAAEQSWGWEEGSQEVGKHTAHVRLVMSYVLGAEEIDGSSFDSSDFEEGESGDDDEFPSDAELRQEDDLPLVPEDYDPMEELNFLTKAVAAILEMPEAICYFNPGGEVLRDEGGLRRGLNHAWSHDLPPLDMWTNVRLYRVTEEWSVMDTVGNGQFDLPDLEAIFESEKYEPGEVESFLRSASLFMISSGDEVEDGDTVDGPGDVSWMAMQCHDGLSDPPRETIRWVPQDGTTPPDELVERGEEPEYGDDDDDPFDEGLDDII